MIAPLCLSLLVLVAAGPPLEVRRVLVLDVEAVGVSANDAAAATRLVAAAASEVEGVEVVSATDLRRLASLEAEKSAAGCSDNDCLAELAGALGAQLVLFGSLSKLGSTTTASLSLYNAGTGKTERRSVDVGDMGAMPAALRERTRDLLGGSGVGGVTQGVVGAAEPASAGPPLGWIVLGSGAALAAAGGITTGVSDVLLGDPARDGGDKETWLWVGRGGLVGVGLGAIVGVTGAVLVVGGGE